MEIKDLAGGSIVFIKNDGGFMAGSAAKFGGVDTPHTAAVVIGGKVYSIQLERIVKNGQ